jgi:FKBP-type peptidyl-prolyl cis-trans isomerase
MPAKPALKSKSGAKSFLDRVVFSIRALKDHAGSSRAAIAKYLLAEFESDNKVALRKALAKGEKDGVLAKEGQRFRVAGDGAYAREAGSFVVAEDDAVGAGEEATAGSTVVVSYRGTLEATGEVFDQAKSFSFTLGAGEVIKGWDEGVAGMRVGGKRRLVVPPALGYGKKGSGKAGEKGSIPPGATLLFLVGLKRVA